jgi:hypothetical protein
MHIHDARKLADLTKLGRRRPAWAELMVTRRLKTLVACRACHDTVDARQPTATPTQ